jgi:hypothetical protein
MGTWRHRSKPRSSSCFTDSYETALEQWSYLVGGRTSLLHLPGRLGREHVLLCGRSRLADQVTHVTHVQSAYVVRWLDHVAVYYMHREAS